MKRTVVTEEDYPLVRTCTRVEAIKLSTYMGEHVETGKLNRKNYTLRCKNTTMEDVLDHLKHGADELGIDVTIDDKVFVTPIGEKDVLVKF